MCHDDVHSRHFLYLIPPHQHTVVSCLSIPSHRRTQQMSLSRQFSTVSTRFYNFFSQYSPSSRVTMQSKVVLCLRLQMKNPKSMPTHIVHVWLSYCSEFHGSNYTFDAGLWSRRCRGSIRSLSPWNSKHCHLWEGLLRNDTHTHYGACIPVHHTLGNISQVVDK